MSINPLAISEKKFISTEDSTPILLPAWSSFPDIVYEDNRGMYLSLRRNSDVTSIARIWQAIFQITTTWSGNVQLLLNGVVQSTSTYTSSYQSIATFTRKISGSNIENMSPIGSFNFESGTHASDYFFDLDRSDIFSVTEKS